MSGPEPRSGTVHASAVAIGESGILIRGPSGAGKSRLARELITHAEARRMFACLVADDRVRLDPRNGRLLARPVAPLAGFLEVRGLGLAQLSHEEAAVLTLVVDLEAVPARLPQADELTVILGGVSLPRIKLPPSPDVGIVMWRLCAGRDTLMTVP